MISLKIHQSRRCKAETRSRKFGSFISASGTDRFLLQEARSLKAGELSQQESKNMAHSSMKVTTDMFSHEKTAMEAQQQRQIVTSSGMYNQEKKTSSSQSNITTYTAKGIHTSSSSMLQSASQVSFQKFFQHDGPFAFSSKTKIKKQTVQRSIFED